MPRAFLTVIFIIFSFLPAFSEGYTVIKTSSPVVIDGKLDEADWVKAEKIELKDIKTGKKFKKESWFKMMRDADTLYVGAFLAEKEVEALVPKDAKEPRYLSERPRDPEFKRTIMFNDSYAEVFLDPDGDGKKYIELHINAAGRMNDWWINEPIRTKDGLDTSEENFHMEWDLAGAKYESFVYGTLNNNDDEDKGWSFEIAIPYAGLKEFFAAGPKGRLEDEKINALFVRVDQFGKGALYETWPVVGEFNCHRPDKFGELRFR